MGPRFPLRPRDAALAFPLLALLLSTGTGCGLFFRTTHHGRGFVIYSDRDAATVARIGSDVEAICRAYAELFEVPRDRTPTVRIFIDESEKGVIDHAYSPTLLGYYVPVIEVIAIDARAAWTSQRDSLRQVLRHELAHHFAARRCARVGDQCWLNEGLASALEVSQIERDRAEYPLFHPTLARLAREAVKAYPGEHPLRDFLALDWQSFHRPESRVRNYALAWATVYFLLERFDSPGAPLPARIGRLLEIDPARVAELERGWSRFVGGIDESEEILLRATPGGADHRLTYRWAVAQIGLGRVPDDARAVARLTSLCSHPDREVWEPADHALLSLLWTHPHLHRLAPRASARGLDLLSARVADEGVDLAHRVSLLAEVRPSSWALGRWTRALVPLLASDRPELRAAAASTLARLGAKPTVVNPSFWRWGSPRARGAEVSEWVAWLERNRSHKS